MKKNYTQRPAFQPTQRHDLSGTLSRLTGKIISGVSTSIVLKRSAASPDCFSPAGSVIRNSSNGRKSRSAMKLVGKFEEIASSVTHTHFHRSCHEHKLLFERKAII